MNTSGYTTILLEGQQVGLKFGLRALQQLAEKEKKVPFYQDNTYSDLGIAHIMYAGYCNNQYIKDADITIPFESFYNIVEDCFSDTDKVLEILKPVIECFENSKYVAPLKQVIEEAQPSKKKSGHGTTSKATATAS
jgi:hypothetical protein